MVPVIYDKYDRLVRLARTLQEVRVAFILATTGLLWSLLIRYARYCFPSLVSLLMPYTVLLQPSQVTSPNAHIIHVAYYPYF